MRGTIGWAPFVWGLVTVLALSGCVGVTSRSDFSAEVRARGGGFDGPSVQQAVDRVAKDMGPGFGLVGLTVSPQSAGVSITARRDNGDVDQYTFTAGSLRSVSPVRTSPDDHPEGSVPPVDAFAIDRLDELVTEALDRAEITDGYVESVQLRRATDSSAPEGRSDVITVEVDGPRSAATIRFSGAGEFLDREAR